MSLKSQVAHGLKWQAISIVGRQLISLVVFTTLARLLQPASFGLLGLVSVYLGFVGMFADQGISTALVQKQNLEPAHLDTAFWFNVGCATFLCLGTVLLAGPVAAMFGEPQLVPLLRCSSLSLLITAVSAIHGTIFVKQLDFRRPALRILVANTAGGVVGICMALSGFEVWSLVGQQLAFAVAGAIFLWTASPYRPSLRFSLAHLRELFQVSTSVLASALLWFLSTRLDQIIIGRFAGVPALGMYTIGGKVPDIAKIVTHDAMADVSMPALSKLQKDYPRMCQAIYRGMEMNAFASFAIFIGIASIATDLVPFLFGIKWAAASNICALLSLYALANALQVFFHPALLASGGAGKYVLLNVCHVIGVSIACLVGIHYGVQFLILGLVANTLIMAIPSLLFLRKRVGLSPWEYCKPCLAPALAALLMFLTVSLTRYLIPASVPAAIRLLAEIVAGAAMYLGFTFLFKRTLLHSALDVIRHAIGSLPKALAVTATPPHSA